MVTYVIIGTVLFCFFTIVLWGLHRLMADWRTGMQKMALQVVEVVQKAAEAGAGDAALDGLRQRADTIEDLIKSYAARLAEVDAEMQNYKRQFKSHMARWYSEHKEFKDGIVMAEDDSDVDVDLLAAIRDGGIHEGYIQEPATQIEPVRSSAHKRRGR